jgi:hypothetical protein
VQFQGFFAAGARDEQWTKDSEFDIKYFNVCSLVGKTKLFRKLWFVPLTVNDCPLHQYNNSNHKIGWPGSKIIESTGTLSLIYLANIISCYFIFALVLLQIYCTTAAAAADESSEISVMEIKL